MSQRKRRRIIIIIIRRNGAKTISLQTTFGRLKYASRKGFKLMKMGYKISETVNVPYVVFKSVNDMLL
jgi:hypothetical protein